MGGGYGYGYDQPPAPPQQQQAAPQAPPVIINQYFSPEVVRPVMREYNDLPEPPHAEKDENPNVKVYPPAARVTPPQQAPRGPVEDPKANVTLIALKDSTVVAAIGYWAENSDLVYITKTYTRKTLPLDRIDKDLTEQLNRERGVEFLLTEK